MLNNQYAPNSELRLLTRVYGIHNYFYLELGNWNCQVTGKTATAANPEGRSNMLSVWY